MKTKLTVTIDQELIPRAKQYARARGVSLSSLIESALRALDLLERGSFSSKWRGRFEVSSANQDPTSPRFEKLSERFL